MTEEQEVAEDLADLEQEELALEAEETIQPPPEEPEVPDMDHPPGEYTEYSDKPMAYEVLRLSRANWTGDQVVARFAAMAKERSLRLYGDLFWDSRWYCWRAVK
jgi:hypothetical protein